MWLEMVWGQKLKKPNYPLLGARCGGLTAQQAVSISWKALHHHHRCVMVPFGPLLAGYYHIHVGGSTAPILPLCYHREVQNNKNVL
jgi:hypothetical protein